MAPSDIAQTPVALVYQSAGIHAHLRQALGDVGASVVYESAAASFDRRDLDRSGATVVVVNLDPDSDEDLDAIDELLVDEARRVIVNDGESTSKLSGWDQARWARHLVAKIFGGTELLPERPLGAEEVPVRKPPTTLAAGSAKQTPADAAVINPAMELRSAAADAASLELTVEAESHDHALTARDELDAALRDFGFVDHPASDTAKDVLPREANDPVPASAESPGSENPFDGLDFGSVAEAAAPSSPVAEEAFFESDESLPIGAKPADEFESLFAFDSDPTLAKPRPDEPEVAEEISVAAADFDLDWESASTGAGVSAAAPTEVGGESGKPAESLFDFDFEFDAASTTEAAAGAAADQATDALVDFDQAFAVSAEEEPAKVLGSAAPSEASAAAERGTEPASGRGAASRGERSIEQLLAGLDLQLTGLESEPVAAAEQGAVPAAGGQADGGSSPDLDRFSSFSFELEAIEEAPDEPPERPASEQILLDSPGGKRAGGVPSVSAKPEGTAAAVPGIAAFDNLFDEAAEASGAERGLGSGLARVWVLGASIGGPDAVREFLSGVPAHTANLFLLAQHMGADFVELMIGQLARATALPVGLATTGMTAAHGQVLVVPLAERLLLDEQGQVTIEALPAPSAYSPSIDQVLKDVADRFGSAAGTIIFSGMAHDAIEGAKYLASKGGVVWAQDPATCVVSSMIDGAIEAGIVKFVASPAELATRFVAEFP